VVISADTPALFPNSPADSIHLAPADPSSALYQDKAFLVNQKLDNKKVPVMPTPVVKVKALPEMFSDQQAKVVT